MSFIGFLVYYLHYLEGPESVHTPSNLPSNTMAISNQSTFASQDTGGSNIDSALAANSVQPSVTDLETGFDKHIMLLLGGYSYGSLILSNLPPVLGILERFQTRAPGTAAAEIKLRARTLARQTLTTLRGSHNPYTPHGTPTRPKGTRHTSGSETRVRAALITMGGEETDPNERRGSREAGRSFEIVRSSSETPRRLKLHLRGRSSRSERSSESMAVPSHDRTTSDADLPAVKTTYLLISPLLPPISTLLCISQLSGSISNIFHVRTLSEDGELESFMQSPTLAVFGSSDDFTSSRKLCAWAQKLSKDPRTNFQWKQIDRAAHFWRERGAMPALTTRIRAWVQETLD